MWTSKRKRETDRVWEEKKRWRTASKGTPRRAAQWNRGFHDLRSMKPLAKTVNLFVGPGEFKTAYCKLPPMARTEEITDGDAQSRRRLPWIGLARLMFCQTVLPASQIISCVFSCLGTVSRTLSYWLFIDRHHAVSPGTVSRSQETTAHIAFELQTRQEDGIELLLITVKLKHLWINNLGMRQKMVIWMRDSEFRIILWKMAFLWWTDLWWG